MGVPSAISGASGRVGSRRCQPIILSYNHMEDTGCLCRSLTYVSVPRAKVLLASLAALVRLPGGRVPCPAVSLPCHIYALIDNLSKGVYACFQLITGQAGRVRDLIYS